MPLRNGSTVLVPVDVSDVDPTTQSLVDLCRSADVVLLGYYPVPDQVAPAQLRADHEADARATLDGIADAFRDAGVDVTDTLVFTHDRDDTIDRVADEHDCDAVLSAGAVERVESILALVRGDTNLERIVSVTGSVMRENDASVTFFHAAGDEDGPDNAEFLLRGAADRLVEAGVDRDRIDWLVSDAASPADEIVDLAGEYDLLVLGETKPSLRERILGSVPTRIVDEVDRPAFIVRNVG